MPNKQSVLITGCSEGGIGAALCAEFQKRGYHVIATARNLEKLGPLSNLPNVTAVELDVTKPDSIATARDAVTKLISGGRLNVLVNNSGVQYVAPLLDFDVQLGRDMYEVNVWGVLAMVQAFAPLLIKAKGTVCNISSFSGLLHAPWMGVYGGSKAALSMISETMRLELAPFNVHVITCITGAIKTNIMSNSWKQELPEDSLYKPASKEIAARAAGTEEVDRSTPQDFAQKLVSDIVGGASGKVYRGKLASIGNIVSTCVPAGMLDGMVSKGTGLEKLS